MVQDCQGIYWFGMVVAMAVAMANATVATTSARNVFTDKMKSYIRIFTILNTC